MENFTSLEVVDLVIRGAGDEVAQIWNLPDL